MKIEIEKYLPHEIEIKSFEIITNELLQMGVTLDSDTDFIVKRAIHTSADFDYVDTLKFSQNAVANALDVLKDGATIITDTNMGKAGINKVACAKLGVNVECFIADDDVAEIAKANGSTRAVASVDKALSVTGNVIFAVGNAPTALIRLYELISENRIKPALVVGVPVGFVNVVESKNLIKQTDVDFIVNDGRKGGSNVAAAICNALLYKAVELGGER